MDLSDHSILFTQNYGKSKNMKSKIKLKIHLSTIEVHFLDVTVSLKYGKLRTALLTKPTNSHSYLDTSFCHQSLNMPKRTSYSIATYMFKKIGLSVE